MKNKKRILMILTRDPYPTDNGRKTILAQTIDFLKDDYELYLLIFSKNSFLSQEYKKRNVKFYDYLTFPSIFELIKNIIFRRKYSLQENFFYSKKSKKNILNTISNFKPDIIYADMIRTGQYIEKISHSKKIIDIDDLLSIRYKRFINESNSQLLGTFSNVIPLPIRYIIEKFFHNPILLYESKKIKKRELEVIENFNLSFLVSQKEVNQLKKITGLKNIHTNTQAIKTRPNIYQFQKNNNFVFIGNMLTPQNKTSLEMIIHDFLPFFDFNYKLYIIGKFDKKIEQIAQKNQNIVLMGYVENLEEVLKNMKLALMPIAFGTGIKTKILDCMSYGIPVITNDVGNEGLDTKHMKDIVLIEKNNFYEVISKVIYNKDKLKSISQHGYKYISLNHNYDILKNNFNEITKKLIQDAK